jgi:hypothetical protein
VSRLTLQNSQDVQFLFAVPMATKRQEGRLHGANAQQNGSLGSFAAAVKGLILVSIEGACDDVSETWTATYSVRVSHPKRAQGGSQVKADTKF